jgi:catechol 2,3-dioxygenase-like lactoylglutathione lyase family enzyme
MAKFLHTMVRVTDPAKSRAFYEALGFRFNRDMDIVRNGELEATNYFYSIGDAENVLELTRPRRHARAAGGTGHRTGAAAVPGDGRRLADLLRPRTG